MYSSTLRRKMSWLRHPATSLLRFGILRLVLPSSRWTWAIWFIHSPGVPMAPFWSPPPVTRSSGSGMHVRNVPRMRSRDTRVRRTAVSCGWENVTGSRLPVSPGWATANSRCGTCALLRSPSTDSRFLIPSLASACPSGTMAPSAYTWLAEGKSDLRKF